MKELISYFTLKRKQLLVVEGNSFDSRELFFTNWLNGQSSIFFFQSRFLFDRNQIFFADVEFEVEESKSWKVKLTPTNNWNVNTCAQDSFIQTGPDFPIRSNKSKLNFKFIFFNCFFFSPSKNYLPFQIVAWSEKGKNHLFSTISVYTETRGFVR